MPRKPRILCIVDTPGWAVDIRATNVAKRLTQYDWTLKFHSKENSNMVRQLGPAHDLIWCANHDVGPKYPQAFTEIRHPRVVVTFRSWRYRPEAVPFIQSGQVHAVTAVNQALTAHVSEFYTPVHYIAEGIADFFKPTRVPIIGFVGRPDEYKGFPLIQAAVHKCGFELRVAPQSARCLVSGQSKRAHEEMPAFYESCDAIVVASLNEGAGTIAMEAMAMNIPVLTTRCGVAADLDALYIERSVEGIEAGLLRLFGRAKVLPTFTVARESAAYATVFDGLLQ